MEHIRIAWRPGQPQLWQAGEQAGQGDLQLQPGQWCPDAEMQPPAKGQVDLFRPRRIKTRRPVPGARVAVGGRQQQTDLVAPVKAVTQHLDRRIGVPREQVQRRIKAQQFLDRARDPVRQQGGGRGARFQQGLHPVAQAVHGSLVARVQQQDAGRDHLVRGQTLAVGFGGDQMGDQIVGGSGAAVAHIVAQEGHEAFGGGHRAVFRLARATGHIHAHHGVGPTQQVIRHRLWHAQQPGDDDDRQLLSEMAQQVERPLRQRRDQIVAKRGNLRLQRRDPARGEGAQHQAAQAGVARRFQFQHRMGFDRVKGGKMRRYRRALFRRHLAPKAAVAQDGIDPGRRGATDQAVIFPEKERPRRPRAVIERVGVLHKLRIGGRLVQAVHDQARRRGRTPWATATPSTTMAAPAACAQFQLPPSAKVISMT